MIREAAAARVAFRYNPASAFVKVVALGTCPLGSCGFHTIGFELMGVLDDCSADMCVLWLLAAIQSFCTVPLTSLVPWREDLVRKSERVPSDICACLISQYRKRVSRCCLRDPLPFFGYVLLDDHNRDLRLELIFLIQWYISRKLLLALILLLLQVCVKR